MPDEKKTLITPVQKVISLKSSKSLKLFLKNISIERTHFLSLIELYFCRFLKDTRSRGSRVRFFYMQEGKQMTNEISEISFIFLCLNKNRN